MNNAMLGQNLNTILSAAISGDPKAQQFFNMPSVLRPPVNRSTEYADLQSDYIKRGYQFANLTHIQLTQLTSAYLEDMSEDSRHNEILCAVDGVIIDEIFALFMQKISTEEFGERIMRMVVKYLKPTLEKTYNEAQALNNHMLDNEFEDEKRDDDHDRYIAVKTMCR